MKMDAMESDSDADGFKLQLVTNGLWREVSPKEQTHAILKEAVQTMRDGYSLGFPIMIKSGRAMMGVALVAKRDWRTSRIKEVEMEPAATHLAILLLFRDAAEWKAQAAMFTQLWPEQPKMPLRLFNASGQGFDITRVEDTKSRV